MMTLDELLGLSCSKNLLEVTKGVSYDCQIKHIEFIFHKKDIQNVKDGDLVVLSACIEPDELILQLPTFAAKKIALILYLCDASSYQEFFEKAKQHGLPVLQAVGVVPFYDLIRCLCQKESREDGMRFANHFLNQYRFNEKECLSHIVKTLEQIVKLPIWVFDCDNKLILSGSGLTNIKPETFEQLSKRYEKNEMLRYSLGHSGNLYILCKNRSISFENEEIVKSSLLALAIGISDYRKACEENRNKFIYDILKRKIDNGEISKARIIEFGLDPEIEYFCIAIELKRQKPLPLSERSVQNNDNVHHELSGMVGSLSNTIRKYFQINTIVMADDQVLVIFWPIDHKTEITKKSVNAVVQKVLQCCHHFFGNDMVTVGVSSAYSTILQLNIPYNEAVQALQLGSKIFGLGTTTHFDDLSMYRILLEMDDIGRIDRSLGIINKITEYDQNNNTELMRTLEVYYENNFNLKATSSQLFLHYNSIQYRLKKISEITGLDITSSEGVFTMMVGMKLKNYSK